MKEEKSSHANEAADDAQRKIGRNLLCFQHVEHLLKFLLFNRQWIVGIGQGTDIQERREAKIRAKTMGQLVGQFAEELLVLEGEQPEPPTLTDVGTGWLRITFGNAHDSECRKKLQAELEALVSKRNDLIHHFLPMWNSTPMDNIHQHLDQQHEELRPILDRLKADAQALQDVKKQLAGWLASDEARHAIERSWLLGSPLVVLLDDIARQRGGWMPLDLAGQLLRQHKPEDFARMQERYGHKTLKRLLMATQLFEVADLSTGKGSKPAYRIKSP